MSRFRSYSELLLLLVDLSGFLLYINSYMLYFLQFNALLTCNHDPSGSGNSGDFDFWSSKSLLIKPHPAGTACWYTTAVFPCSLLSFHFTALFAYVKQTRVFPPHYHGKTLVKAPFISTAIPRPPPGLWGGGRGYK